MAKLSSINKNNKRIKLSNKFYAKRMKLKKIIMNKKLSLEDSYGILSSQSDSTEQENSLDSCQLVLPLALLASRALGRSRGGPYSHNTHISTVLMVFRGGWESLGPPTRRQKTNKAPGIPWVGSEQALGKSSTSPRLLQDFSK